MPHHKNRKEYSRHGTPPRHQSGQASFRVAVSQLAKFLSDGIRALRHARRDAARRAGETGRGPLVSMLVRLAAAMRKQAARLEGEARVAMDQAREVRESLPELLEPRDVSVGELRTLVYELGQPLTAREAFAHALGIPEGEVTVANLGKRRAFLPRNVADALVAKTGEAPLVLLTRLRRRERSAIFRPGRPFLRSPRGGAISARDGCASGFYFPGTARLAAGSTVAIPAATLSHTPPEE